MGRHKKRKHERLKQIFDAFEVGDGAFDAEFGAFLNVYKKSPAKKLACLFMSPASAWCVKHL